MTKLTWFVMGPVSIVPRTAKVCASTMTVVPTSSSVTQTSLPSGLAARLAERADGIGMRFITSCVLASITSSSAVREEFTEA